MAHHSQPFLVMISVTCLAPHGPETRRGSKGTPCCRDLSLMTKLVDSMISPELAHSVRGTLLASSGTQTVVLNTKLTKQQLPN